MLCLCNVDWRCCVNADTDGEKFPGGRRHLQLRPSRSKQDQKTRSGGLFSYGRNDSCVQKGRTRKSLVGWFRGVHEPHALSQLTFLRAEFPNLWGLMGGGKEGMVLCGGANACTPIVCMRGLQALMMLAQVRPQMPTMLTMLMRVGPCAHRHMGVPASHSHSPVTNRPWPGQSPQVGDPCLKSPVPPLPILS